MQDVTIKTRRLLVNPDSEDFDFILFILTIPVKVSFDLEVS